MMRNILKMMLLAVIVLVTACNESVLDDMTGKYPPPTDYTLTNLLTQEVQKLEGKRIFTLDIAGNGNHISIDFVGKTYFLEAGTYTIAPYETAKAGNYIAGYDANNGTCFFEGTNGAKVTGGTLNVAKNGDNYTIAGVLALNNGNFIRVSYAGTIIFPEDPPAYTYSVEISAPYVFTLDGMNYTPVPGSQLNKITVKSDGAPVAYFEMVTEGNPASYSGTYTVKSVNSLERAICQGQYLDLAWFGMAGIPPIESGSYLTDGADKQFVRSGSVTVTDNGGVLSFASSNLAIQDIATQGQFGTLPNLVSINYVDATKEISATHTNLFSASALDLSMFGLTGFTVTVKVATPNLTVNVEQGPMGTTYTYAGSGQYISFDFSRDAGTFPPGVYNVVNNATAQVNDCLAGYPSLFGAGFMGTFVGNVVNGVATEEVVTGGTVTVTDSGFSFSLITASGTIDGNYVGAIVLQ